MSNNMKEKEKMKKIVPSKLENFSYQVIYNTFGKIIPKNMTPNQMTFLGCMGSLFGIICAFLSIYNRLFLIGTIIGLLTHLICDDLDGFIARRRNMSSESGAFFDLLTDIMHITYLLIALSFSQVASFEITIFLVPVYALLMFTAMNYIRYFNEFLFPRLGPIETHLLFILICILTMILGTNPIINIFNFSLKIADILFLLGGIPMYYEMIRLQIQLFKRLNLEERQEK